MDQPKIGRFLKELRKEKNMTQEQLSETLGVSNRSISRWENGSTMPDLDLLIQIAKYFDVEIGELLDGERKRVNMNKKTEETLWKVADYNNAEKMSYLKNLSRMFLAGIAAFIIFLIIDFMGLANTPIYESIASFMLGIVFGDLLLGTLYCSRYMSKIRAAKKRLLKNLNKYL